MDKKTKKFEPCPGGCGRQVPAGSGECRKCRRRRRHSYLERKYRQPKED